MWEVFRARDMAHFVRASCLPSLSSRDCVGAGALLGYINLHAMSFDVGLVGCQLQTLKS